MSSTSSGHPRDARRAAVVSAWMDRLPPDPTCPQLLRGFEAALQAVWDRAHQTLGAVTLVAIADRILYTAAAAHPVLSPVSADEAGFSFRALHERVDALERHELAAGLRRILDEFLRVLGNLTADILTPALHAALSSVEPPADGEGDP